MKRRMPFWITTPSSAATSTAAGIAAPTGQPWSLDERQEAEERAEHRDRAIREVDDPGPAVDEHDALCEQRVRRTRPESEDRELNCLSHARSVGRQTVRPT